jgi:hypothetical protein
MNIYFLVEGKRTEMKVYPEWLSVLIPALVKVQWHHQALKNNYYIFTGNGFPSLLHNHLKNSIADINTATNFDYLVICLDTDEDTVEKRKQQVLDFITEEKIILNPNTELVIIPQNKCFETWFLGNRKIFKKNPSSSLLNEYISHYHVKNDDPELMNKPINFEQTTAIFHAVYLQEIFVERKIRYTKRNPEEVIKQSFLAELIKRSKETNHISTFKYFIDFCKKINEIITK